MCCSKCGGRRKARLMEGRRGERGRGEGSRGEERKEGRDNKSTLREGVLGAS